MIVESIAISAIIILMIMIFVRSHKKQYALLAAPLLVTPILNIAYIISSQHIKLVINAPTQMIVLIVALAVTVGLMGIFSINIKNKKYRWIYLCICTAFSTALTLIFLYNLYIL